ncbi:low molecular weight phosphotyrosine protein phosphatase [Lutibacter sp. A80]|uniref:low molecular weight protein-tyrosine-phosphatase n=1 Tax=Lutibacter sp. A80 TaxID=2918453 RepID=UPI001F05258E|nr:low molecular weight protein-tyrosine-phosphatase [Lutibacter sp. A80]UMB60613.1 low molecular weight phosphotyrosine protein phosphatase [Lutibacter sp. A80]
MTRVLMVCLGNICRSPLAEGILKSKVIGSKVFVDSAGTGAYHVGEQPDTRSIAIANLNGIDITDQKARKFNVNDFELFDIIYVMDNSNYKNVISLAKNSQEKSKVKLILNEVFPNENLDVPDPYYGGEFGFKNVYKMLNEACEVIAKKIN